MNNSFYIPDYSPIKSLVNTHPYQRGALVGFNTPFDEPPPPRWMNRRVSRQRTKLPRLKRKERLNWHEWLSDWYSALHKLGFRCRNDGINPNRKKINAQDVRKIPVLYMQKGDQGVALYSSVKAVPPYDSRFAWLLAPAAKTIHRIVQGRRRDPTRGVVRVDGTKATGIIPRYDIGELAPFYVDFDGALFEGRQDGLWEETKNIHAVGLYGEYLNMSEHYKSIRPYYKRGKPDCPTNFAFDLETVKSGFDSKSIYQPITKLL